MANGEAWLSGWSFRKSHVINNSTGAGANYPVCIKVYKSTGTDGTESYGGLTIGKVYVGTLCKDDFSDVRFTDNDGNTELKHWTETLASGTSAIFWVNVADSLDSVNQTIYVYYGKSDAANNDDAANTFVFFDDFDGSAPDTNVWTVTGSPTCSGGILHIVGNNAGVQQIISKTTFGAANLAFRSYAIIQPVGSGPGGEARAGFGNGEITDSEAVWLSYQANDYGLNYKGAAGASVAAGTHTGANYYTWEVEWQTATVKYRRNGDSYDLATDTPIVALSVWIRGRNYDTTNIYANWALVRKFISPEPVHSTWGPEESSTRYEATLYFTAGANIVRMNGTSYANSSILTVGFIQNNTVVFEVLTASDYTFKNWTYDSTANTSNPFYLMFDANYTVWCYLEPWSAIYTYAVARFDFSPSNPGNTTLIVFNGSQSYATDPITNFAWNFGDGNTTDTGSTDWVCHVFGVDGIYTVVLTVTAAVTNASAMTFQFLTVSAPGGGGLSRTQPEDLASWVIGGFIAILLVIGLIVIVTRGRRK